MYSLAFSILFVSVLVLTLAVRFWLASRQIRHVLAHRAAVPAEFAEKIAERAALGQLRTARERRGHGGGGGDVDDRGADLFDQVGKAFGHHLLAAGLAA